MCEAEGETPKQCAHWELKKRMPAERLSRQKPEASTREGVTPPAHPVYPSVAESHPFLPTN